MFNVVKPEYSNKTFRLPVELIKRLEEIAQSKSISVNNLVVQCCEYALTNLKDENDD
jgi:predicted HicB family RNase H-like nuclease